MTEQRAGTVALVGPPNAGKSTLLNALLGEPLAIVAPKPQTTRRVLRGVLPLPNGQAVLIDTPGLLEGRNALERGMRQQAVETLREADLVLALVSEDTREAWLGTSAPKLPKGRSIVVVTKADLGGHTKAIALGKAMEQALGCETSIQVAALKKRGLEPLIQLFSERLPVGPPLYDADTLTDMDMRTAAAEIIREQTLMACRDEVPHSVAVGVDDYKEREDGIHEVHATLYVERESQKAIVIGAGGERLKHIGTKSRLRLEKLVDAHVFLKLWVKVSKDWKENPRFLKELGYPSGKKPRGR